MCSFAASMTLRGYAALRRRQSSGDPNKRRRMTTGKRLLFSAVLLASSGAAAEADVEVQCQMGSSCVYQKMLSRNVVKHRDNTTVINARIRSCYKNFGPYNEKTGRISGTLPLFMPTV
jgi:hypothetical protein